MQKRISATVNSAAVVGVVVAALTGPAVALELITPQEAALPNAVGVNLRLGFRGVTRGPRVLVLSPALDAGMVRSPLNLLLKFETHGGAVIDLHSVKMTYLKKPLINLTQRVGDLIKGSGIELYGAEVPPGTHYIRVEIKDDAGRVGSTIFALMVAN
jgi:hypothetical protein